MQLERSSVVVLAEDLMRAQNHVNDAIELVSKSMRATPQRQAIINALVAANWDILPTRNLFNEHLRK